MLPHRPDPQVVEEKEMAKKEQEAAALKLALEALREKLSSEAFYERIVHRFQERRPMTQEKAWDEIDDFLEKADLIAQAMVDAASKKK